jgi:putative oxidoreductase
MRTQRVALVLLWIVQILAAAAFVAIGYGKFSNPFWLKAFPRWGYSDGFRVLIGVAEMVGGVLLAFPQTAAYAAVLIDAIMLGAVWTLVTHQEKLLPPIIWLVMVSGLGYARRRRAWRPASASRATQAEPV